MRMGLLELLWAANCSSSFNVKEDGEEGSE
jgi:hypothetical protein